MTDEKYIGLDVHQATISVAVMDSKRQVSHGVHPGNESRNHSGILCGTTRNLVIWRSVRAILICFIAPVALVRPCQSPIMAYVAPGRSRVFFPYRSIPTFSRKSKCRVLKGC
jgi:hypothetical protein